MGEALCLRSREVVAAERHASPPFPGMHDGSFRARIFLVNDSSGGGIEDDGAFGPDDGSAGRLGIGLRRLWSDDERTWIGIGILNAGGGFVRVAGDEKKANDEGEDLPNGHGVKIAREGWAGKGFAVVGIGVQENRGRVSLGEAPAAVITHTEILSH